MLLCIVESWETPEVHVHPHSGIQHPSVQRAHELTTYANTMFDTARNQNKVHTFTEYKVGTRDRESGTWPLRAGVAVSVLRVDKRRVSKMKKKLLVLVC